jgi:phospholipid/cholesterol/gamma-HCH transport system permease protein
MKDPISWLGALLIRWTEAAGRYVIFTGSSLFSIFQGPTRIRMTIRQMQFVGVQSLLIVLITGFFTGAVFAYQSKYAFEQVGAETMIGATVGMALVRELGPVLSALMVNGRVGSAMAAELGTMRVTEQIDALEAMAVNPLQYLVAPRIIAATLMVPALTAAFDLIGVIGSYLVCTKLLFINAGPYIARLEWYMDVDDPIGGLVKASVFGMILSSVGCFYGFHTKGGAEGVGIATTKAVVAAGVAILISDYFLTLLIAPLGVG